MAAGDIKTVVADRFEHKPAVVLDGVDDYVLADAHAVARVAANDVTGTYSAWIILDEITTSQTILSAGDNSSTDEYLRFYVSTGQIYIRLKHGGADQFIIKETTASIKPGIWTHVAVVQEGRPILYVNGKKRVMTDITATDLTMWYDELTLTDKFAIGVLESNATHTQDYGGAIGEVKYWNKALTADEVYSAYQGNVLSDDGTYLQLDINMDGDVTDAGLGADDGTLVGNAYLDPEFAQLTSKLRVMGPVVADNFSIAATQGSIHAAVIKAA